MRESDVASLMTRVVVGARPGTQAHGVTPADVMTIPVATIGPDEPASAAARELAARNVRRLFVVDTGGRLVGVLARRDLLRVFLRTDEELRREVADRVVRRALWLDPAAVTVEVAWSRCAGTSSGAARSTSRSG
ncbi:CBS domain-containing protein [Actinosynnema sp. NPDC004786]